jgi:hypothetical protein
MKNKQEIAVQNTAEKYGFMAPAEANEGVKIEQSRAAHEMQAKVGMAKMFPRNVNEAFVKIINACQRPTLAEQAIYAFPRGNQIVKGPSIRFAEVIMQNWGNIFAGVKEISQTASGTLARAFAWDLETNTCDEKEFYVSHKRHTRQGSYDITDPRDIYEKVANEGARRKRSCILAIIPGDVTEAAIEECEKTMKSGKEPIEARIKKLILAFDELGVSVPQIEKRLGHNLTATIETELVTLRQVYKSIKDGMASREDFFDFGKSPLKEEMGETKTEKLADKLDKMAKIKTGIPQTAEEKAILDASWEGFQTEEEQTGL